MTCNQMSALEDGSNSGGSQELLHLEEERTKMNALFKSLNISLDFNAAKSKSVIMGHCLREWLVELIL